MSDDRWEIPGERLSARQVDSPVACEEPVAALTALASLVDSLQTTELSRLDDRSLVALLDRLELQARRLPAVRSRLVSEIDGRGLATGRGYRSTAAWLSVRFRIGAGEARTWIRGAERHTPRRSVTGEALPARMPATAAARAEGRLSDEQTKIIDSFVDALPSRLPTAVRDKAEADLVDFAADYGPVKLARVGQRLIDFLDPDGTLRDEKEAHRRRGVVIGPLRHGLARISGYLDAYTREALLSVLGSLDDPASKPTGETAGSTSAGSSPEPEDDPRDDDTDEADSESCERNTSSQRQSSSAASDCSEPNGSPDSATSHGPARETGKADDADDASMSSEPTSAEAKGAEHRDQPEDDPPPLPPERPPSPQRTHDALRGALERLLAGGGLPRRGGYPTTILLTVPLATLEERTGLVSTAHGGLVSIDSVIRRATETGITLIPIVLDRHGDPLRVGRRRRLAGTLQRYALQVRDGGCVIPSCPGVGPSCDSHHLLDFADGGPTDIENLALACPFHHQRVDRWTLRLQGGRVRCTPVGLDPGNAKVNTYHRE